jgi:hypothetical protein
MQDNMAMCGVSLAYKMKTGCPAAPTKPTRKNREEGQVNKIDTIQKEERQSLG